MTKFLTGLILFFSITFLSAQTEQIDLAKTTGVFNKTNLTLEKGQYQFNVINDGVDHEVGFVLVPKGKYEATDHIKPAYVNTPVAKGKNLLTNVVTLKPGEYEYFCPLNPTAKYSLSVED